jgi:excisionase family DNA binding protein
LTRAVALRLTYLTGADVPATITVEQTAEVLSLSRSAVYEGVKRGDIPSLRIGRRIIIPVGKLLDWLGAKKDLTVIVPDEPPELTPRAARALLRILLDAAMKEEE